MRAKKPNNSDAPIKKTQYIFILQGLLLLYSIAGILSKSAAYQDFLSPAFFLLYGGVLAILFFYAIVWQYLLKKLPLTVAFSNKAVTVIWGIIWGLLFFNERLTVGKIVGAAVIVVGILLMVNENE